MNLYFLLILKNLLISKLTIFVAAIWWGSLTTLGFFVVPMLFQYLPAKALAGNMAARLFEVQTWVSVGCGLVLMLILRPKRVENHLNTENNINKSIASVFVAYSAILFSRPCKIQIHDQSTIRRQTLCAIRRTNRDF